MTTRNVTRILRALSAEPRLQIVLLLRDRALCVNALAARLGMTSSAVSQHLRVLRDADLVTPDRRGYYVHYELNKKTLRHWKKLLADTLRVDGE